MADEQGGAGGADDGGAAQDIQKQVNEAIAKLSGPGEQLIALGAALVIFVDIFADLIFDEWGVTYWMLAPAWIVVGAIFLHRFRNEALPISYGLLIALLGLLAGGIAVREILGDLEANIFDRDTAQVVYALITWAGGILMLVGGIQLWPSVKNG